MHKTLLVLLGPTGSGKTDVSIVLAKHFNTEIISSDSRQFFHEIPVGTSAPAPEQLKDVKHHFIANLSLTDYYSASRFEAEVLSLLDTLFINHETVIMAGGSGLYIDAVCNGIDDIPDVDPSIREKYTRMYMDEGVESLRNALKILDPEYYSRVDLRNYKRIIRALEICETTGRPYSSFMTAVKRERNFRIIKIGLERPREELFSRINQRVDKMVENGLEEEARKYYDLKHLNSLNTVGYKEFFEYFDGKISREKAIELIKRDTRRYAKRQLTWWAKDKTIKWLNPDNPDQIISWITDIVKS